MNNILLNIPEEKYSGNDISIYTESIIPKTKFFYNDKQELKLNCDFKINYSSSYLDKAVLSFGIIKLQISYSDQSGLTIQMQQGKEIKEVVKNTFDENILKFINGKYHKLKITINKKKYKISLDDYKISEGYFNSFMHSIANNVSIAGSSCYVYIKNICIIASSIPLYLIKQNNKYYSLKSLVYELGQPKTNQELEKWYKENGIDDLNALIEKKNSKSVDLKLDKNDIYKTISLIDLNEAITNGIEYIDNDNKKEIEYNVKEYQLLNLVKEKIGSKFQIAKWEEGDNIE
ncbi:hypothetical protein [Clostridium botulinum]|uniref:hypothetical protein n=1 Tax=Clostridium botulinum C phage TaxID=12336 RepID=UPI00005DB536|nr:hypothetical protein [Clostridium botulinum]YP_398540.1 hypothetical protein CST110 [Clostridium phage c-st]BAE47808.1 conserved hypothetical protein [Clostridium phage c-st]